MQNEIAQIKSDLVSMAQKADAAVRAIQDTDNKLRAAFEDALKISVQERVREEENIKGKVEEIIRIRDVRENEFKKKVEEVIRVRDNYTAVITSSVDQKFVEATAPIWDKMANMMDAVNALVDKEVQGLKQNIMDAGQILENADAAMSFRVKTLEDSFTSGMGPPHGPKDQPERKRGTARGRRAAGGL